MKKRLAIALIAAAIAASGSAFAADGTSSSPNEKPSTEQVDPIETPAGADISSISFANIEESMRNNNPRMLAIEENMAQLDDFDREKAYNDLLDLHNSMTDAIWAMLQNPQTAGTASSMLQQQQSIRDQMEMLKEDEYAITYEDQKRQIESGMDQMVYMGESLYLQVLGLEQSLADGQRGLAALDRQLAQAEKSYSLGQLSEIELLNLKNTRATTASSLETLSYNITTCKLNLQSLLGAEPTGDLTLAPLPAITGADINALNPTEDLGRGMEANLSIYQAKRTADDAKEALDDATFTVGYERKRLEHTYQSAQYSYQAACLDFKLQFNTLYTTLGEKQRLVSVEQNSLDVAKRNFEVSKLQYERGLISESDYLDAQDTLAQAQSAVDSAFLAFFTTYNQYQWAARGLIVSSAA